MSLSSALATAMSGLRANQAALSITSSNIANTQTPGYVAKSVNQVQTLSGDFGAGVNVTGVSRQLDQFVQSQLRSETSGGAYADQMASVLTQLQSVYGTPGDAGTLETAFSNFTTALQSLSTTSGSSSSQISAATAAQALAQQLNVTTQGIQTLRSNAEQDINISVGQANTAMTQIAHLNVQLQGMSATDPTAATLMDQRDQAIDKLSQLMDIRVSTNGNNQATIYTTNGVELVGAQASTLSFNSQGTLNANSQWNANPANSSVGTISIKLANGAVTDMIGTGSIISGQIAADVTLRDKTLVQAQAQVDQLAASLASALSNKTTAGTAAPAALAPKAGFDLDLSNVLPGNTINLTYTDTTTNTQHQVSIVRVDDPAALPLSNVGGNPNNPVIGVNFTGGMASVVAQLNAALGSSNLQFSNPAGSTLRVLDNGTATAAVNAASVTTTVSSLASGGPQLPLFTDGNALYTGAITAQAPQQLGLAGRITVNAALLADPSKFTVYNTSPTTPAGDTTRSDFLYSQLTSGTFTYSPQTGLGTVATPFKGTLSGFMQQFLSLQSNASTSATQLQQGQDVVVNTLQQKMKATSGVNIDTEVANLIALQNSYAANAHVMSVVQTMMSTLMQVQL
ncbi:flagellar hook-associated protein FlgK [Bradyrhizobium sp. Ash2021]|uniref:flagellar hook-associated protein FlgK n=1 Tax=Bradyrhizobium sp. Ash2021 TaxID=2954771 RepID=UPI0028163D76|nr:flagellar hook-associated protein FlgK [Bradyrhizobium sp. Ash2021]WMT72414.1 flagellar hook-associated protein FlgK [Bradyrhizobium sp. Ash2021]